MPVIRKHLQWSAIIDFHRQAVCAYVCGNQSLQRNPSSFTFRKSLGEIKKVVSFDIRKLSYI